MPIPFLPTELLSDIFFNLSSSSSDLYHVLLACHAFSEVVKPILYHAITITTQLRRTQLLSIKKADKQRVRKVVILGCGKIPTYSIEMHFGGGRCDLGPGCVEDLLEGKLLDITGGGNLWRQYLTAMHAPKLRRLAYRSITEYSLEMVSDSAVSDYGSDDDKPHKLVETAPSLAHTLSKLNLEVLVGLSPPNVSEVPNFPLDNFLALLRSEHIRTDLSGPYKFCRLLNPVLKYGDTFVYSLELVIEAVSRPDNRLLCLFLTGCPASVNLQEYQHRIDRIRSKGVKVIEDGEEFTKETISLIPASFVRYLEKNGKIGGKQVD